MADAVQPLLPEDAPDLSYREPLYAGYVSMHAGTVDAGARGQLAAYYQRHILPRLPAERRARIVDVACGAGELLAALAGQGYRACEGVDRSGEQVRAAHENGVTNVVQGDALDYLRERRDAFDAIVAVDFLEHLTKTEVIEFLHTARLALRPGGRLVVQTCNGASPMFGRIRYGDFTHETAFTDRSITQVFLAAGLAPAGVYGIDPVPHGLRSRLRALAWGAIKLASTCYLAVETGVPRGHIISQNLVAVATREESMRVVA